MRKIMNIAVIFALAIVTLGTAKADWNDPQRSRDGSTHNWDSHHDWDAQNNTSDWRYGPGIVRHDYYYHEPERVVVAPRRVVLYNETNPYVRVRCTNGVTITETVVEGAPGILTTSQFAPSKTRIFTTPNGTLISSTAGMPVAATSQYCAAQALEYARPDTQVVWEDNGSTYLVEPVKTYRVNGEYCREYHTRVEVNGRIEENYGKACRGPSGAWEVVD